MLLGSGPHISLGKVRDAESTDERVHIQSLIVGQSKALFIGSRQRLRQNSTDDRLGCNRPGHLREACFYQTHPDFNKADRELQARGKKGRELKLEWKSRTDGTHLPAEASAADDTPTPPRNRREHDRRDRDGGLLGRGGRDGRGHVYFDKDKGTPCLTSIITHLRADINSIHAQLYHLLHCVDTGAYTSFVNREVAKWLELRQHGGTVAGAHHARSSRHDVPTFEVDLAGVQLSSSIYGTVVFD